MTDATRRFLAHLQANKAVAHAFVTMCDELVVEEGRRLIEDTVVSPELVYMSRGAVRVLAELKLLVKQEERDATARAAYDRKAGTG